MMMELVDDKKKLWSATRNLEKMKKLLLVSNEQCSKMGEILTHFDDRLLKLEETVQPVYKETGDLQNKQENINATLNRLDYVIKFYTVAGEVEATIVSGPSSTSFELYIRDLNRLSEAVKYFQDANPDSPEMMNVTSLLEKGGTNIEKEFRLLLSRHSSPVPVKSILDLINTNTEAKETSSQQDGSSSSTGTEQSAEVEKSVFDIQLPEKSRRELKLLAEWLCENRNDDFISVYAMIRSDVLSKSLNNLRHNLKSASLGTVISSGNSLGVHISPLLGSRKNHHLLKSFDTGHIRRTPKSTTGGKSDNWQGFGLVRRLQDVTDMLGSGSGASSSSKSQYPFSPVASGGDPNDENIVSEREILSYVACVTGLYKLMQLELRLLESIIPRDHQRIIFSRLVMNALDSVYQEGENLSSRVKRCVQKQDFSSALYLLPVLRYHAHMRHSFDILLDGCEQEVQKKLHSLVVTLQTTISKSLEEFIEYIKSDIHTRVPRDGTVHELTSNVMLFLEHLLSYLDILSRVVTVTDIRSLECSSDKNRVAFAQYISRVLSALGLTLCKKAESYSNDYYLQALFLLNNTHYILRTLRTSSLLQIVHLYNEDIESAYEDKIRKHKQNYLRSWDKVLSYMGETNPQHRASLSAHAGTLPSSLSAYSVSDMSVKLKDKDRQAIKANFTGFNKEFELIRNTQTGYAIPDRELRDELKRENIRYIVPKYELFYEKFRHVGFAKNVAKYIKYSPELVAQAISTFFDSAA